MEDKLQELTEKIYKEGIEKANVEATDIISKAKKGACKIIEEANSEARYIITKAQGEAKMTSTNIYCFC